MADPMTPCPECGKCPCYEHERRTVSETKPLPTFSRGGMGGSLPCRLVVEDGHDRPDERAATVADLLAVIRALPEDQAKDVLRAALLRINASGWDAEREALVHTEQQRDALALRVAALEAELAKEREALDEFARRGTAAIDTDDLLRVFDRLRAFVESRKAGGRDV